MAERMSYEVPPPKTAPDAHDALHELLHSLHRHGFLRLANDMVCANTQIAKVLVDGLNKPGSQNALQNLSALLMALADIPPGEFYKTISAVKAALNAVNHHAQTQQQQAAPGVSGTWKLLHDEDLWHAVMPLVAGLKAFAGAMEQPAPEKPISAFSGKDSHA
ncbi:DUF1641 domain-containing protein [Mixta tenebrionis]|uniref:DUF1641 domain-containing protein n=1 Tax=Mixta tenebrionis TaxID=2562439 RepID=A0A506VE08_9GAMM|nr:MULTISPECIES: DUF1641 domain-containing protein [Mixta]QHM75664.1 hypothetical protein C7M52_01620 [Mixta theicola]TPW44271.1 DUF1641 domain-containing protein [Mixta tenebrionis]